MSTGAMDHPFTPERWSEHHFGSVALGDRRRNQRARTRATAMLRRPSASLPAQVASPAALNAADRLLASEHVSFAAFASPRNATHTQARHADLVLLVQDTTELDDSQHPTTTGLGPIGNPHGQRILRHATLAVRPQARTIRGRAAQEPLLRPASPHPPGRGAATRRARARKSPVWERARTAIGPPPPQRCWIHVGDRDADMGDGMEAGHQQGCQFLVRAAQNRQVPTDDAHLRHVMTVAQHLCPRDRQALDRAARPQRPARRARGAIGGQPVQLQPPAHSRQHGPLPVGVIGGWEADPPADVEAVEWGRRTSVPTTRVAEAWERRAWAGCRWLIDADHQCLNPGCRIEQRQVPTGAGRRRILGILAPMATDLLQLRALARQQPAQLAQTTVPTEVAAVVAALADVPPDSVTVGQFWPAVARAGGYLGRRRDGPPGGKTLWHGWLELPALLDGIQLAARLPLPRDNCG